ncbi:MAG: ethanolamine utilization protein EutH [Clostridia bacterium]|nr:ethanolamine utilization protein EutH [Clostridia bacterium]
MTAVQIVMAVMAVCALLGGADRLLGNRFRLGEAFEEGFKMLGPIALSMAGIICLAPLLTALLRPCADFLHRWLRLEPGMAGALLAIDMGGWDMATGLAADPAAGRFAGIAAASTLGCTLSFTIPMGIGLYEGESKNSFMRGILYGLSTLPFGLLLAAVLGGIPFLRAQGLCLPAALFALLIAWALKKFPRQALRAFSGFSWLLRAVATAGLAAAAFQTMTEQELIPGMAPLNQAMETVSSIGIVLLGALPLAELLRFLLRKPLEKLGGRIGIDGDGLMCLAILYLSITPGLIEMKKLDCRAQMVCAAFSVCAASALTAHFAFAVNRAPEWAVPMLAGKLTGAVLAAALALRAETRADRRVKKKKNAADRPSEE